MSAGFISRPRVPLIHFFASKILLAVTLHGLQSAPIARPTGYS
jgi:hypothetical protein